MKSKETRIDLHIDIGTIRKQRARALGSLLPAELVQEILAEFQDDLDYLSDNPAEYQLSCHESGTPLTAGVPLAEQLQDGDCVLLEEVAAAMPEGGRRPAQPIYLRDQQSKRVYRLPWVPAIIGRPDSGLEGNQLLAVNLESLPTGPRVSRRHARINEEHGRYTIESLSPNPTLIRNGSGSEQTVASTPQALHANDVIVLERSSIELRFIVRTKEPGSDR